MADNGIQKYPYKGNLILKYPDGEYVATMFNGEEDDIISQSYDTLKEAKRWLDNYSEEE